jgi:hypothetical protein
LTKRWGEQTRGVETRTSVRLAGPEPSGEIYSKTRPDRHARLDVLTFGKAPFSGGDRDAVRCSLEQVRRWSWREVTLEEASRLQRDESMRRLRAFMAELIPQALAAAPDAMLLVELRRRGLA